MLQRVACYSNSRGNKIFSNKLRYPSQRFSVATGDTNNNNYKKKKNIKEQPDVNTPTGLEEIRKVRMNKLNTIKEMGLNPFEYNYDNKYTTTQLQEQFKDLPDGEEDASAIVSIAGRIMLRRVFGKLAFFTLQDDCGSIQLYIDKKRLEDQFKSFVDVTDSGDIIGVEGTIKRTEKGELSVYVNNWKMLTKSLLPLPDKYKGFTDINKRYRQRHLDMIVNPEVKKTFLIRSKVISLMRNILDNNNYIEIETPILTSQPGGAEAKPFITYHNSLNMNLTLRIATELYLKRLIIGGYNKVYEIGRIFRNEGLSTRHNPEFTSIELYESYKDYNDMMILTENMISNITNQIKGSMKVIYQDKEIDFTPPWRRVSMNDIIKEHNNGLDFYNDYILTNNLSGAKEVAINQAKVNKDIINNINTIGEIMNIVFEETCESKLIQPTFIIDYPTEVSPLAKPHRNLKHLVERFELFIYGREHANAFSELTDPIDQRERFNNQAMKKAAGDEEACDVDEEFLSALETGMPPTAGLGIGIDRLVMMLTDSASIKDVIAFPLMKKEITTTSNDDNN